MSYATIGTTTPILIERLAGPEVRPGGGYFSVRVTAAQAAFKGSIWERVNRLLLVSRVSMNHPILGMEPYLALQATRDVQRNKSVQLGLSPVLIGLTPATMDKVTLSVEFILDTEDRLRQLVKLIDSDAFTSVLSLAPGAVAAASTISSLSKGILDAFLPSDGKKPLLQFSGDFDVADGLIAARYAILGTADPTEPLPRNPRLVLRGTDLLDGDASMENLSYVVFELRTSPARTVDLAMGATWWKKLQAAGRIALDISKQPFIDEAAEKTAWVECNQLLKEAHALIQDDPLYIEAEATAIINEAYDRARSLILPARGGTLHAPPVIDAETRRLLSVESQSEIGEKAEQYRAEAKEAKCLLVAAGAL